MKKNACTLLLIILLVTFFSCNEENKNVAEEAIVTTPEQIDSKAEEVIQATLKDLLDNKELADSFQLKNTLLIDSIYEKKDFAPVWSFEGNYTRHADSLYNIIQNARLYGFFPNDYYADKLTELKQTISTDSLKKLDASKWALNDLLLTSAFTQLVRDLKTGRIVPDSIIKRDVVNTGSFLSQCLDSFIQNPSVEVFNQLEPRHKEYAELKKALGSFLDSANFRDYTYIHAYDSGTLKQLIYKRIDEEDSIQLEQVVIDSIYLADAIKKYQKLKKLRVDGKISSELIKKLNDTDEEKFIRIAITMDRYKMLSTLPDQYIWVNIPSYQLKVKRGDSILLTSKVAVGKTYTRTPEIVSAITDMITYPQWTIPASIIEKEILPGLKRDAGYTNKKGYSIIDKDGNVVDPYFVDWSKYKKGIPYKVVQGSGDANALGVIKFNFPNKHSVYLHDTNQRYLFSRKNRALSHGCVRVESWRNLAYFILESDSLSGSNFLPKDSLNNWLSLKQKKVIPVRSKVPLYLKYFTCEGLNGKIIFYDDIYEEDRKLRNKYFATK
jgi:L,D-transpeptidase YcbB